MWQSLRFLVALAVLTCGGRAAAQNVAVLFDASAADLPQADIRAAVARELGVPPDVTVVATAHTLNIAVDGEELVVRASGPEGDTERRLALPREPGEVPELIALLAVNLTRDQRLPTPPATAPATTSPAPVPLAHAGPSRAQIGRASCRERV